MKWIKIGLVLSLLLFPLMGYGWKSGCSCYKEEVWISEYRVDSINSLVANLTQWSVDAVLWTVNIYRATSQDVIHTISLNQILICDSVKIDSIEVTGFANSSDSDSLEFGRMTNDKLDETYTNSCDTIIYAVNTTFKHMYDWGGLSIGQSNYWKYSIYLRTVDNPSIQWRCYGFALYYTAYNKRYGIP